MSDEPDEIGTAYHEAGHAVAAITLGTAVRSVSIVPDAERGLLGHVAGYPARTFMDRVEHEGRILSRRDRTRVEHLIMQTWAGTLAEQRYTGSDSESGFGVTLITAGRHKGHQRTHEGSDAWWIYRWAEAVSQSDGESAAFAEWLRCRADTLVARHWSEVEAVAAALLANRRMTGRAIREVVAATRAQALNDLTRTWQAARSAK
jgi:hypothetical protein